MGFKNARCVWTGNVKSKEVRLIAHETRAGTEMAVEQKRRDALGDGKWDIVNDKDFLRMVMTEAILTYSQSNP